MIFEQKLYVPSSTKTVQHEVAPCVQCDSENIKIDEYEDQYGFISTATCKKCGQKIKQNTSAVGIVKAWNRANDIDTLLANKASLIEMTKGETQGLKQIQKRRTKKTKPE